MKRVALALLLLFAAIPAHAIDPATPVSGLDIQKNASVPIKTGRLGVWIDNSGVLKFFDGTTSTAIDVGATGVTSVATGNGLTGGTITSTGTIDLLLNGAGGLSKTLGGGSNELGIATGGVTAAMLANTAVTPTGYGDASHVGTFTVDAQGRLTAAASTAIAIGDAAVTYASRSANLVFASPNGSSGAPTYRALVNADFPTSGVTAATYGDSTHVAQPTVNAQGIVTGVANVAISASGIGAVTQAYSTVDAAGSALTQRSVLNFSALLAATDNSGSTRTDVTLADTAVSAASYGSGTQVAIFTVDAQGRLTAASNTTISSTTVNTSSPLGGGGAVAPGGTLTLTCSTCITGSPSATGDMLYSTAGGQAQSLLAVGTVGKIVRSTGTVPAYSTATYPNTVTTGDLVAATGTNAIGSIAAGATNTALLGQGAGTLPAYGTVPNAALTNSTITTSSSTLTGTGSVALGATQTLNVSYGTTSNTATQGNDTRLPPAPSTQGRVLYDTGSAWAALGTGTDGYVLTTHGAAANPTWASAIADCPTCILGTPTATGDLLYSTSGGQTQTALADVAAGSWLRAGGVGAAPGWSTTTLPNSATTGDLLYASGSNAYANLADVTAGSLLRSGGSSTAPAWSTTTWPNSATTGDLLYASGSNAYANLADVTAGSFLRSGGSSTAPAWSTLVLPNAATTGDIPYASASNTVSMLADVTAGSFLRSGGSSTAPVWSTTTWPNAATTGDIIYATGTNAVGRLADVATNQVLLSGGVGAVPTYGTVPNAALTNSSVTVNTSSPLGGGGAVSLGGTLTLTCSTCITGSPSATGDLLYSTAGGQAQTALADVAAGSYLRSGGSAAAPVWSTLTIPNAATTGDILYATGTNAIGRLADVATGQVVRSGGVGAAPAWGALVAGDLPGGSIANSVSNSDGTLTISPTTGAVVASIALSHANTWTALQTHNFTSIGSSTITPGLALTNTTTGSSQNSPSLRWSGNYAPPCAGIGIVCGGDNAVNWDAYLSATGTATAYQWTLRASKTAGNAYDLFALDSSGNITLGNAADSTGINVFGANGSSSAGVGVAFGGGNGDTEQAGGGGTLTSGAGGSATGAGHTAGAAGAVAIFPAAAGGVLSGATGIAGANVNIDAGLKSGALTNGIVQIGTGANGGTSGITLGAAVTLSANVNVTATSGTGAFDLSGGSGIFKTSTGAVTIGNGAVGITGAATFSGGVLASGSNANNFSGGSGAFDTSTGTNTLRGTVSVSSGKSVSSAGGAAAFDWSSSSGAFDTSTGTNTLHGTVSVSSGKGVSSAGGAAAFNWSSSSGAFDTSTGTNTLNGATVWAANKGVTVTAGTSAFNFSGGTGAFQTTSGLNTINGKLAITPPVLTSGAGGNAIAITGASHTGLTNSETSLLSVSPNTVQFTGGSATIATQRAINIGRPLYDAASSGLTITNAVTLEINNAPGAGSANVTITNPWALRVLNGATSLGAVTFGGDLTVQNHIIGAITAPTITIGSVTQLGTTPSASVVAGTDLGGTLRITTGTTPAAFVGGTSVVAATLNFGSAYAAAPSAVVLTPAVDKSGSASSGATGIVCYADRASTTTAHFVVKCVDSGAGTFAASTNFDYAYVVIQ